MDNNIFFNIFNAYNTRDYTNTSLFLILLRDLLLSVNSTFPAITKSNKLNNLLTTVPTKIECTVNTSVPSVC